MKLNIHCMRLLIVSYIMFYCEFKCGNALQLCDNLFWSIMQMAFSLFFCDSFCYFFCNLLSVCIQIYFVIYAEDNDIDHCDLKKNNLVHVYYCKLLSLSSLLLLFSHHIESVIMRTFVVVFIIIATMLCLI